MKLVDDGVTVSAATLNQQQKRHWPRDVDYENGELWMPTRTIQWRPLNYVWQCEQQMSQTKSHHSLTPK